MAENESQKSSTGIAMIVGGLVVAVLVIGYFVLGGDVFGTRDVDVDITVPAPADSTAPAQPPAAGTTTQ
jgi:hypothetical protein